MKRSSYLEQQLLDSLFESDGRPDASTNIVDVPIECYFVSILTNLDVLFSLLPIIRLARHRRSLAMAEKRLVKVPPHRSQISEVLFDTQNSLRQTQSESALDKDVERLCEIYDRRGTNVETGLKSTEPKLLQDKEAELVESFAKYLATIRRSGSELGNQVMGGKAAMADKNIDEKSLARIRDKTEEFGDAVRLLEAREQDEQVCLSKKDLEERQQNRSNVRTTRGQGTGSRAVAN